MRWYLFMAVIASVMAGCAGEPDIKPQAPALTTDGPNQVLITVGGMTCPACQASIVQNALESLSWVDKDHIRLDVRYRLARFTVRQKSDFKLEELNAALAAQKEGFFAENVRGPTE